MVKVIYFNQWFSSIANVIKDIKNKHGNEVKIIASSKNPNHAYRYYVDTFEVEDWEETDSYEESMNNYVEWTVNLCKKYKVDFFFVKKHAIEVMKNRLKYSGTFLVSEDYYVLNELDNKADVYNRLSKTELLNIIPEYYSFKSLENALVFVDSHRGENKYCLKLNSGEGGTSFRAIRDNKLTIESLYKFRVNEITSDETLSILFRLEKDDLDKILIMELLEGPEISVDCYNSKNGFVAICRAKEEGRLQKVFYNNDIYNICKNICCKLKLLFPFNVQFRLKPGSEGKINVKNLRLLEINPRMSGGLYYEVAVGLNICEICLMDLTNNNDSYTIDEFMDFETKYITKLETPIVIEEA